MLPSHFHSPGAPQVEDAEPQDILFQAGGILLFLVEKRLRCSPDQQQHKWPQSHTHGFPTQWHINWLLPSSLHGHHCKGDLCLLLAGLNPHMPSLFGFCHRWCCSLHHSCLLIWWILLQADLSRSEMRKGIEDAVSPCRGINGF